MASCVCRSLLPSPSARRSLLCSAGDASNRVREFLETFVTDGGSQIVSDTYMCKSCLKRTESLQRQQVAVETSINALRAQMVGEFSSPIQLVALDKTADAETDEQLPCVPVIDEGVPGPGTSDLCHSTPRRSGARRCMDDQSTPIFRRAVFTKKPQSSEVKVCIDFFLCV